MKNNLYLFYNGEMVDKYENVIKVTYEKNELSFYIGNVDYSLKDLQTEVVLAPQTIEVTEENYKDFLLNKELTQQDQEIETLKQAITELTMIISEG